MSEKKLDRKLASIAGKTYQADDFIIADAKDADMAFGLQAPWFAADGTYRTRDQYLDDMRGQVTQGTIDILLTSASNGERLAGELDDVTLAVRANDTTDVWNHRGGAYTQHPSRPFRTVDLAAIKPFCDLVLYSVTFNHDLDHDLATLEEFRRFRREAGELGIRYFLEVFNPNAAEGIDDVGAFVNDSIMRSLAGVTRAERPVFLKMAYNGTAALAELVDHDSSLVVGVLGGSAGTTRDTFELLRRTEQAGGRVALFGRKIQRAESQLDLVALMRPVLRGEMSPEDAVRAYHEALAKADVAAARSLEDDLRLTDPVLLAE